MITGTRADLVIIDELASAKRYISGWKNEYSLPEDSFQEEADTYTLIPNGTRITYSQGDGKNIKAFLVQHDQSGRTIQWEGSSPDSYRFTDLDVEDDIVFEDFLSWNKSKRKKWYVQQFNSLKAKETQMYYDDLYPTSVPCQPKMAKTCGNYNPTANQITKATAMNTTLNISAQAPVSEATTQRQHLLNRLYDIDDAKYAPLRTHFKVDPVEGPKTLKDLFQKIKDGDYTVDEKFLEKKQYSALDALYHVRWTKEVADQKGYEAAVEAVKKDYKATKDTIMIADPKEGLEALRAFEAKTFH